MSCRDSFEDNIFIFIELFIAFFTFSASVVCLQSGSLYINIPMKTPRGERKDVGFLYIFYDQERMASSSRV